MIFHLIDDIYLLLESHGMKNIFTGKVIFIDGTGLDFKTKTSLKNFVVNNGGQVSFSLNKKVTCAISGDVLRFKGSSRGESCKKLKIPVLTQAFLVDSVHCGEFLVNTYF